MYVSKIDAIYMRENKVLELRKQYEEKFGVRFISFNYADFPGTKDKCAAQMYKEAIERALKEGKPYHIVSHRYDEFDH